MAYLTTTYDSYGFFRHTTSESTYLGYKPASYTESTPMTLFVWMHGCGGQAEGDMWAICPSNLRPTQKYIAISIGGKDGKCWDADVDYKKVLAAIEDVKKYFNIGKVILGGYSSGGDISYYTAFFHSDKIAGVVVNNSSPFKDSGNGTQAQKLAAAKYKFNVYQMSHTGDTTYKINEVKAEIEVLKNAGYPVKFVELPGTHWDAATPTSGTNYDFAKYALPFVNDNDWKMPSSEPVITPPTNPTLPGFTKSNNNVKYPEDQGITFTKNVKGYSNVKDGNYSLIYHVRTTSCWAGGFSVDIICTNNSEYDISVSEITLDLRNHTLSSYGGCIPSANSGIITAKLNNPIIGAKSKAAFNMYLTRSKNLTDNYYQVLVKAIKW